MSGKVEELAKAHWNYVESLIIVHHTNTDSELELELERAKFHYIKTFIHGYKHGIVDGNCECGGKCEDKKKEPEFVPHVVCRI